MPRSANIIDSHFFFNIKVDDSPQPKLKAHLVLYGNKGRDRYYIQRELAAAELFMVRLSISLTIILGFEIATGDVRSACTQSSPIQREIFVKPPNRINNRQKTVWKLQPLPHKIVESGGQWLCAIETWLASVCNVECVSGVERPFYNKAENGRLELLFVKNGDNFLVARFPNTTASFTTALDQHFQLGHIKTVPNLQFFEFQGSKDMARDLHLSTTDYL